MYKIQITHRTVMTYNVLLMGTLNPTHWVTRPFGHRSCCTWRVCVCVSRRRCVSWVARRSTRPSTSRWTPASVTSWRRRWPPTPSPANRELRPAEPSRSSVWPRSRRTCPRPSTSTSESTSSRTRRTHWRSFRSALHIHLYFTNR